MAVWGVSESTLARRRGLGRRGDRRDAAGGQEEAGGLRSASRQGGGTHVCCPRTCSQVWSGAWVLLGREESGNLSCLCPRLQVGAADVKCGYHRLRALLVFLCPPPCREPGPQSLSNSQPHCQLPTVTAWPPVPSGAPLGLREELQGLAWQRQSYSMPSLGPRAPNPISLVCPDQPVLPAAPTGSTAVWAHSGP